MTIYLTILFSPLSGTIYALIHIRSRVIRMNKNVFDSDLNPVVHYPQRFEQPLSSYLEPVCCKKRQKIVPDQLLVCGEGDL